jgi:DNA-binding MurR/RpiR family transcriptional regulator
MNQNAIEVDARLRQLMPEISGPMAGAIRFILANREEIPVRSMRELAKRANVPPVTLVRLAQRLGFEGFDEFREVYVEALISGQGFNRGQAAQLISLARAEGTLGFATKFAEGEFEVQRQAIACLKEKQLNDAVGVLTRAERIFVIGRRPFFAAAFSFAYSLRKAKPNTHLLDAGGGMALELDRLTNKDVIVGFTSHPYSRITLGLAQMAHKQGATVIAVTDSENAPIASIADHLFLMLVRSYAFPDSISGAQLIGNILVGLTVSKLGLPALEGIQRNETEIRESGEYVAVLPKRPQRTSETKDRQVHAKRPSKKGPPSP